MRKSYHHGDLKNALIQAGAEILASEGVGGLTLRKAAQRAGVTHSAPYAHFADKQALVAAISTDGLRRLRERIEETSPASRDPLARLVNAAWETVRFGIEQPDHYRVTFSNAIEQEHEYPAYVATAHGSFEALEGLIRECQEAGVIAPGPADVAMVAMWSQVHGLTSLLINRQVPRRVLRRYPVRKLLLHILASHLRIPDLEARVGAAPRGRRAPRRVRRRRAGQS